MSLFTFLKDREPAQLRGLMLAALTDTASILAGTVTDDTGGGGSTTWGTASTGPCRIDPLPGGSSRLTGGQIDERSTHIVTVPPGVSVNTGSRVQIASRGVFEVTGIRTRTDARSTVFEVKPVS